MDNKEPIEVIISSGGESVEAPSGENVVRSPKNLESQKKTIKTVEEPTKNSKTQATESTSGKKPGKKGLVSALMPDLEEGKKRTSRMKEFGDSSFATAPINVWCEGQIGRQVRFVQRGQKMEGTILSLGEEDPDKIFIVSCKGTKIKVKYTEVSCIFSIPMEREHRIDFENIDAQMKDYDAQKRKAGGFAQLMAKLYAQEGKTMPSSSGIVFGAPATKRYDFQTGKTVPIEPEKKLAPFGSTGGEKKKPVVIEETPLNIKVPLTLEERLSDLKKFQIENDQDGDMGVGQLLKDLKQAVPQNMGYPTKIEEPKVLVNEPVDLDSDSEAEDEPDERVVKLQLEIVGIEAERDFLRTQLASKQEELNLVKEKLSFRVFLEPSLVEQRVLEFSKDQARIELVSKAAELFVHQKLDTESMVSICVESLKQDEIQIQESSRILDEEIMEHSPNKLSLCRNKCWAENLGRVLKELQEGCVDDGGEVFDPGGQ